MGLFGCCVILGFYEAHFRLIIVSLILRLQNVLSNKSNADLLSLRGFGYTTFARRLL